MEQEQDAECRHQKQLTLFIQAVSLNPVCGVEPKSSDCKYGIFLWHGMANDGDS